MTYNHGKNIL